MEKLAEVAETVNHINQGQERAVPDIVPASFRRHSEPENPL